MIRCKRPSTAPLVLRYGGLYGPGITDDLVQVLRKRQFPLVGGDAGYSSWVHLDDAASVPVRRDGQDVADIAASQLGGQLGVGAVDLVTGHP